MGEAGSECGSELVRARIKDRLRIDDGYTIERHLRDHRNEKNE